METKELVTRINEVRLRISDPKEMVGKLLAESVKRTWTEDFLDEDSGEITSVERAEVVVERGKRLTPDDVARITFYQQEGSVKDILITNQDRPASYNRNRHGYFEVLATAGRTKKRLLVYSKDIPMALQIAIDYCEQVFDKDFCIDSIKLANDYRVISLKPKDNEEVPTIYYTVTITYYDSFEQDNSDFLFLTLAKDADTAIDIIRAVISSDENLRLKFGDNYIISVSKSSSITDVVPLDFSQEYYKYYKAHEYLMEGTRVGVSVID